MPTRGELLQELAHLKGEGPSPHDVLSGNTSVGRIERRVQLDINVEFAELANQDRTNDMPVKLTFTATKRRHGHRLDTPTFVMLSEVVEPVDDVLKFRD